MTVCFNRCAKHCSVLFFRISLQVNHSFQFVCLDWNFRGKYCNATLFITKLQKMSLVSSELSWPLTHGLSFITDPILRSDLLIIIGHNFPSGSLTVSHIHCSKIRRLDHISVLQNEWKGSCHIISTLTSSSMYFYYYFYISISSTHMKWNMKVRI